MKTLDEVMEYNLNQLDGTFNMIVNDINYLNQEATEPEDKILIAIEYSLINGDIETADKILRLARSTKLIKNPEKYQRLIGLGNFINNFIKLDDKNNYYDYAKKIRMNNVEKLTDLKVDDTIITKYTKDIESLVKKSI